LDNVDVSCLFESEINALQEALDDEFKAWATYDPVIHDFAPIRPFINIRDSEARHIDALLRVFRDYHDASQQRHLPALRRCLQRNRHQDSA